MVEETVAVDNQQVQQPVAEVVEQPKTEYQKNEQAAENYIQNKEREITQPSNSMFDLPEQKKQEALDFSFTKPQAVDDSPVSQVRMKQIEERQKEYEFVANTINKKEENIFMDLDSNLRRKKDLEERIDKFSKDVESATTQEQLNQLNLQREELKKEYQNTNNALQNSLKERQVILAQKGELGGFLQNKLVSGFESFPKFGSMAGSYIMSRILPEEALGGLTRDQAFEESKQQIDKAVETAYNTVKDMETTKEYMEAVDENNFMLMATGGLVESAPAMLGGIYGLFQMGARGAYDAIDNADTENKLSATEKIAYATGLGIVQGALERAGLSNLVKGNAALYKIYNKLISDAASNGVKVTSTYLDEAAKKLAIGFLAEAETGGLQELSAIGSEKIVNLIKGEEIFDEQSFGSYAVRVLESAAAEGIGGGIMVSPSAVFNGAKNKKVDTQSFEAAEGAVKNPEFNNDLKQYVQAKVESGEITKEKGQQIINDAQGFEESYSKIPESLTTEQKKKAFELLVEKSDLEKQIEGKDKALVQNELERIKNIDDELANVRNIKEEPKAEEQKPQEESKQERLQTEEESKQNGLQAEKVLDNKNALNTAVSIISKNESINENELETAREEAYQALSELENDNSEEATIMRELIEDEIQKIESYENITTTEARKIAEAKTVRTVKKTPRKTTPSREKDFVGKKAKFSDNKGNGGRGSIIIQEGIDGREYFVLEQPNNDKVILGRRDKAFEEGVVNFNEKGNPTSVTFPMSDGKQVTIQDSDIAKEFELEQMKQQEYDEQIFEEIIIEFVGEEKVEVRKSPAKNIGEQDNAKEQQNIQMRPEGEQEQAEGTSNSNMPEGNKAELQDGEVDTKEALRKAKENLASVWEEYKSAQKNIGVKYDPKSSAELDVKLTKAIISYVKAQAIKTAEDVIKAVKDMIGISLTSEQANYLLEKTRPTKADIAEETEGLSNKEVIKQFVAEYEKSKNEEYKEKEAKLKEKVKLKAKEDKEARIIFKDFIKAALEELNISPTARTKVSKIATEAANVTARNLQSKVDAIIETLVRYELKQETNEIDALKRKIKKRVRAGSFGNQTRAVNVILAIDKFDIPVKLIKQYNNLLSKLAANESEKSIDDINAVADFMQKWSEEIEKDLNDVEHLSAEYVAFKAKDKTSKKEFLEYLEEEKYTEDVITYADENFDRIKAKAKENTSNEKPTTEEKIEKIKKEKKEAVERFEEEMKALKDNKVEIDLDKYQDEKAKEIAATFKAITADNLIDLSARDIAMIPRIIDNISKGMMTPSAYRIAEKIEGSIEMNSFNDPKFQRAFINGQKVVVELAAALREFIDNRRADIIKDPKKLSDRFIKESLASFDNFVKGLKGNKIYEIINRYTSAKDVYITETNVFKNRINQLFYSAKGGEMYNNTLLSVYMRAREEINNPNSKTIRKAIEYVNETLKGASNNEKKDVLSAIRDKFFDNGVPDMNAMKAEIDKNGLNKLIDYVDSMFEKNILPKAQFLSEVKRGKAFADIKGYSPRGTVRDADISSVEQRFNNIMSTKSGNIEERTGAVSELSFDYIGDVARAYSGVTLEYHVGTELAAINNTLRLAKKVGTPDLVNLATALKTTIEADLRQQIDQSIREYSFLGRILQNMEANYTRSTLSGLIKAAIETTLTVPKVAFAYPKIFANAYSRNTTRVKSILDVIKSTHKDRAGLNSAEIVMFDSPLRRVATLRDLSVQEKIISTMFEKMPLVKSLNDSLKQLSIYPQRFADILVTTQVVVEAFAQEFEKITGKKLDEEALINDANYRAENQNAIKKARAYADQLGTKVSNIGSRGEKAIADRDMSLISRAQGFMRSFPANEEVQFKSAVRTIVDSALERIGVENQRRGNFESGRQAAGFIVGQLISQGGYVILRQYLLNLFMNLLIGMFGGDEEDEFDFEDAATRAFADMVMTNLFGRLRTVQKLAVGLAFNLGLKEMGAIGGDENPFYQMNISRYTYVPSLLRNFGAVGAVGAGVMEAMYKIMDASEGKDVKLSNKDKLKLMSLLFSVPAYQELYKAAIAKDKADESQSEEAPRAKRPSSGKKMSLPKLPKLPKLK